MTSTPHHASLRLTFAATALIGALAATGCVNGPKLVTPEPPPIPNAAGDVPSTNKPVLQPGTQVVADTAEGHIKIEAGPGLRRVFDWDGLRRGAIAKPREKRFAGESSKGLYFDGTPAVWKPAKGISKLRYEEGYRNFANMDDAMIWMQIRRLYYTYNNNGLVVGWKRKGDTLQVELWQFTIDGQKPTSMPDSESAHIAEGPLKAEPQKMYPHLVFADGHTEPYNSQTASEYSNAHAGGTAGTAKTSQCNWFQSMFNKCPAPAPAENTSPAKPATPKPTTPPANENAKPAEPAKPELPKATISGNVVNIRSKPTTKSEVLMQAKKGDTVEILKSENKWSHVQFKDGKKGWVADFLLNKQ